MSRVVGIITIYFPKEEQIKFLKKIARQVDVLLVCNNTPGWEYEEDIDNCQIINFGENLGLSIAFNKAISSSKIEWDVDDYIVFFDQDSDIEEGYIARLVSEYNRLSLRCEKLGVLGPVYKDKKNDMISLPREKDSINGTQAFSVQSIITSSMIIKYGVLENVGFWNENIFLDMADFDLCWRLSNIGYEIVIDADVILEHSVGENVLSFAGRQLQIWKPIRNYYRIRDGLKLYHSGYMPDNEKRRFRITLTIEQLINFVISDNRLKRIGYYIKAIGDYRKNINGSYEKNR